MRNKKETGESEHRSGRGVEATWAGHRMPEIGNRGDGAIIDEIQHVPEKSMISRLFSLPSSCSTIVSDRRCPSPLWQGIFIAHGEKSMVPQRFRSLLVPYRLFSFIKKKKNNLHKVIIPSCGVLVEQK